MQKIQYYNRNLSRELKKERIYTYKFISAVATTA